MAVSQPEVREHASSRKAASVAGRYSITNTGIALEVDATCRVKVGAPCVACSCLSARVVHSVATLKGDLGACFPRKI